jgi:hypothetical protein
MSAATSTRWISCSKCSRRARPGQPFCELCGERLAGGETGATGPGAPDRSSWSCGSCGATVSLAAGERTVSCAFCGTPYVAQGEAAADRHAPEFILPFTFGRAQAEASFKVWLGKSGFFVPGDLSLASRLSNLRGVYVPAWTFSMRSDSDWSARIGEYWWETVVETYTTTVNGKTVTRTRTRRIQHTEWYPLTGKFHQHHAHYLVSASRGLQQGTADAIAPFPVSEMSRYSPHFLSGWLCEEYSLEREEAARASEEAFQQRERQDIAAFLPGDTHDGLQVSTRFHDVTEDLVLLPIWIFAYTYRGKVYQYVVNGATGKSTGTKPVSALRIALCVVAVLAILGLLALAVARGRS